MLIVLSQKVDQLLQSKPKINLDEQRTEAGCARIKPEAALQILGIFDMPDTDSTE